VLSLTVVRLARLRTRNVDHSFALLIAAALLASPLGWVYYFWLGLVPVAAWVQRSTRRVSAGMLLLALSVATALLWHASATIWLQPSGIATITVGSAYFWALFGTWLWLMTSDGDADRGQDEAEPERRPTLRELRVAASTAPRMPTATGT
jgi:hypothetical protein